MCAGSGTSCRSTSLGWTPRRRFAWSGLPIESVIDICRATVIDRLAGAGRPQLRAQGVPLDDGAANRIRHCPAASRVQGGDPGQQLVRGAGRRCGSSHRMALCATVTPWDTRGQAIEDELGAVGGQPLAGGQAGEAQTERPREAIATPIRVGSPVFVSISGTDRRPHLRLPSHAAIGIGISVVAHHAVPRPVSPA